MSIYNETLIGIGVGVGPSKAILSCHSVITSIYTNWNKIHKVKEVFINIISNSGLSVMELKDVMTMIQKRIHTDNYIILETKRDEIPDNEVKIIMLVKK